MFLTMRRASASKSADITARSLASSKTPVSSELVFPTTWE